MRSTRKYVFHYAIEELICNYDMPGALDYVPALAFVTDACQDKLQSQDIQNYFNNMETYLEKKGDKRKLKFECVEEEKFTPLDDCDY